MFMATQRFLCCVVQLLIASVSGAVDVGNLNDESCLLQTRTEMSSKKGIPNPKGDDTEMEAEATESESGDVSTDGEEESSYIGLKNREGMQAVPHFTIDLDQAPEKRFTEVATHFKEQYNDLFQKYFNNEETIEVAKEVSLIRGAENKELMGELDGVSKASGIPQFLLHANQLQTPLQTLKGPFLRYLHEMNLTMPGSSTGIPKSATEFAEMFQVPSYGCTGIIAKDEGDGSIWHARNLGYALSHWLQKMTYNAKFTKGGKEVYTAQMVFPALQPYTALRKGSNGYSYELNSRFLDKVKDAQNVVTNLYSERRPLSGWIARKTLEEVDNYEDAVKAFSSKPYPNPEYNIISGVKKGVILARDPDSLAYKIDLGKHRYIIMTNFDYTTGDEKEWYGPNSHKGESRRERAQKILDDSDVITPQLLQDVLNDEHVMHDNLLFQAMINVEHGTYDTALPHCKSCD
jgi:N-acylethanolamine-hydrolysing acid amidase